MSKQSFQEFYDRIPYIILKAPNHFPSDSDMDLEKAFSKLIFDLNNSKDELGSYFSSISDLVNQSLSEYRAGDVRMGIKKLQETDALIRSVIAKDLNNKSRE